MALSPLTIVQAKIRGMANTIARASDKAKSEHVSMDLAEEFNGMLTYVSEAYPDLSEALPPPIDKRNPHTLMRNLKLTTTTYIDLEVRLGSLSELVELAGRDS